MTPHHATETVTLWHGDCLDVLRELAADSVDAVVTDPPYGLGFMGHQWDQPGQYAALRSNGRPARMNREASFDHTTGSLRDGAMEAGRYDLSVSANARFGQWCEAWATECLRVLKPGGHLLSFGGTRTFHRMTVGIEDAGFEIRDSIAWLYGSGFPKSKDVSKAIDRAAGADRPPAGFRPVHDIRNSAGGDSLSGIGNTDHAITSPATDDGRTWEGWGTALKPAFEPIIVARKPLAGTVAANVLKHGTGALNIDATRIGTDSTTRTKQGGPNDFPHEDDAWVPSSVTVGSDSGRWPANVILDEDQAAELDQQSGILTSGSYSGKRNGDKFRDTYGEFKGTDYDEDGHLGSRGGASRFFRTAKAPSSERVRIDGTAHPTVKPLSLMRWLVRLVTPPGGTVLEPFAGSGTTVEACVLEGFLCVAIEREGDYLPLIVQRLNRRADPVAAVRAGETDLGLFSLLAETEEFA